MALSNLLMSEVHDEVFLKISVQDRQRRRADAALHSAAAKISEICPGRTLTVSICLADPS